MGTTVEYGIRLTLDGNRAVADGIDQVNRSTDQVGNTTEQASRRIAASQRELSNSTAQLAAGQANVQSGARALNSAAPSIDRVGVSAAQTANALRGVPAQFTDIVTSIQGGQAPLTVLLQQGGQLRDMFGSSGAAARALGGYVLGLVNPFTVAAGVAAVLALAYHQGSREADAYTRSIILSGNAAGTTSGQLSDMARGISKSIGTQGAAAEALAALVGTGKVEAANLQRFGEVAVLAEQAIGRSVADTAADFADLGKAPLQASEKLTGQYNYLTAAVFAQIKALQDQGREDEAGAIAQGAYADAIAERSKGIKDSLGTLESAWNSVGGWAKKAWDAMLDIGREESVTQKIASLQQKIAKGELNSYSFTGSSDQGKAALQTLRDEQALLQAGEREQTKANETKAARVKLDAAQISWAKEGDKYLTRSLQLEKEITAARQHGTEAQASSEDIERRVLDIRKKYSDIFNGNIDSQIEAVKRRGVVEDLVAKRSLDQLAANRAAGVGNERDYIEQVAALNLAEFGRVKARLQEELSLTAGKQNSLQAQAALRGQIAQSDEAALSRRLQLTSDLYVLQSQTENEVFNQILQSTAARNAANDSLSVEYALYGKSSEARQSAMIAVKAEAELKKYIFDQQRAGKPLTEEMIAQLTREKDVRVAVMQATQGQSQALAYAHQLEAENKKFRAELIFDEKDRAAALLSIDADMWKDRIELAGAGTEAQKKLQGEFDIWYANQSMKPALESQKAMWTSIDSTAREAFVSIGNAGKNTFDRLRDTLKSGLLALMYEMTVKKWIFNIQASVSGGAGGPMGGMSQGAGLINAGANVWGGISGGMASGMGSTVASIGNWTGSSAISSFGAGMQGSTVALAPGVAGPVASGTAASAGAAFATAVPYIAAAAVIYSLVKSMDNSGTYHTGGAAIASSAGVNAIKPESLGFQGTRISAETEKMVSGVASGIAAILNSTAETFGKTAGYSAGTAFADDSSEDGAWGALLISHIDDTLVNWNDSRTSRWAPREFADGAKGQDQYLVALSSSVRTVLDGIGLPSWAQTMLNGLGDAPTIQSLGEVVENINATQRSLTAMGDRMTGFANLSGNAASALMAASGGIQSLTANASSYYENFYNEGEKTAAVTKQVTAALAAVGMSMPVGREAFRAQVEAQLALGETGAPAAAALLSVATAFAELNPVLEATAQAGHSAAEILTERADLQKQVDQLALSSTQLLAQQRDALDESNRALFDQWQALLSAKEAAQAATAAAKEVHGLDIQLMTAQGDAEGALKATREDALNALLSDAARVKQQNIWAANDAAAAVASGQAKIDTARGILTSAYQRESTALQSLVAAKQAEAAATRAQIDALKLGALSTLSPQEKYDEAKRQFDKATGADVAAAGNALLEASAAYNAHNQDYATDYKKVQEKLAASATIAEMQASIAQQQLSALDLQVSGLIDINASINNGTATVSQAVAGLASAISTQAKAQVAAPQAGAAAGAVSSGKAGAAVKAGDSALLQAAKVLYQSATGGVATSVYNKAQAAVGGDIQKATGWNGDPASFRAAWKFSQGGVFTNGVVTKPTNFNIGEMGEAGTEAVMPLVNTAGGLGVRAVGGDNKEELRKQTKAIEKQNELIEMQTTVLSELILAVESGEKTNTLDLRSLKQYLGKAISQKVPS